MDVIAKQQMPGLTTRRWIVLHLLQLIILDVAALLGKHINQLLLAVKIDIIDIIITLLHFISYKSVPSLMFPFFFNIIYQGCGVTLSINKTTIFGMG